MDRTGYERARRTTSTQHYRLQRTNSRLQIIVVILKAEKLVFIYIAAVILLADRKKSRAAL